MANRQKIMIADNNENIAEQISLIWNRNAVIKQ